MDLETGRDQMIMGLLGNSKTLKRAGNFEGIQQMVGDSNDLILSLLLEDPNNRYLLREALARRTKALLGLDPNTPLDEVEEAMIAWRKNKEREL